MIDFEKQTWYNKNDIENASKRIPISAAQLNRIEEVVSAMVDHTNDMANHWWERSLFTLGDVSLSKNKDNLSFYLWGSTAETSVIYYSSTVKALMDEDTGEIVVALENPTAWEVSYDSHGGTNNTILNGKYFIFDKPSTLGGGNIYYSEGYSVRTNEGLGGKKYGLVLSNLCSVSIEGFYENIDYVSSPNKDEYSEGWNKGEGLFFRYLGVPFENARDSVKIQMGTYVGTGTTGMDNPCFLTFSDMPKIWGVCSNKGGAPLIVIGNTKTVLVPWGTRYAEIHTNTERNSVSWYLISVSNYSGNVITKSPLYQFNISGETYTYFAIF